MICVIRPLLKTIEAIIYEPKVSDSIENKERETFIIDHILREDYDMNIVHENVEPIEWKDCESDKGKKYEVSWK